MQHLSENHAPAIQEEEKNAEIPKALPSSAISARWCEKLKGIEMQAWGPNR